MKKKFLLGLLTGVVLALVSLAVFQNSPASKGRQLLSPLEMINPKADRPLDAYTFENLRKRNYPGSEIRFERILRAKPEYTTWLFFFSSDGKKISGAADIPSGISTPSAFTHSVIIMLHGSAQTSEYYPGFGTERVAAVLAQNGYVTLAPDFLGYGESDKASKDYFLDRFQTYTTTLNLIASVQNNCSLPIAHCALGLWGHSNGGQIGLSVLEISGKPIPTVLWNPVSKPFPYSILYFTDSYTDQGKYLRRALARFEEKYDVQKYSTPNFYDRITAPILLQQGGADEWVPKSWSDKLVEDLKSKNENIQIKYIIYPGADHNLMPGWDKAVGDMLKFYNHEFFKD